MWTRRQGPFSNPPTSKKRRPLDGLPDSAHDGRSRGIGWEYVHVAIDDASRLAYVEVLPDERAPTATAFLTRAVVFFAGHGVRSQRLLTDNGSCYVADAFARRCQDLEIGTRYHHLTLLL